MNVLKRARTAMQWRWGRWAFDRAVRGLSDLAPLELVPAPIRIVSMVSSRDRLMYELAIRTLYRQLGRGAVTAIDDGSLTRQDRQELTSRLRGVEIVSIETIETGPCPSGGAWERLLYIADLSQSSYVIQADSDTLTLGAIPEVDDAVRNGRPFVLGTPSGTRIGSFAEAKAYAEQVNYRHVQIATERILADLPLPLPSRYVRGSAGFTGFPKGSINRKLIFEVSGIIEDALGLQWKKWGSEQVISNLLISSNSDTRVLNRPKYVNYDAAQTITEAVFVHFLGEYRYLDSQYRKSASSILRILNTENNYRECSQ